MMRVQFKLIIAGRKRGALVEIGIEKGVNVYMMVKIIITITEFSKWTSVNSTRHHETRYFIPLLVYFLLIYKRFSYLICKYSG